MAVPLEIVAQQTEDLVLQNYRVPTDFFTLDDYIFNCAATAAKLYQTLYEKEYARMRAAGEDDEVVAFSNDFLSDQFLEVKSSDDGYIAKLKEQVFSFAYDQSNVGIQNVFCSLPKPSFELERGDIDEFWQYDFLPKTNKIFWAIDGGVIRLKPQGICNVKEIRVIYVPEINAKNPKTELPDGIVSDVITGTANMMRSLNQNWVQKTVLDENPNKIVAGETNIAQARETLRETVAR